MKTVSLFLMLILSLPLGLFSSPRSYDLVVYGGTSAGISAALQGSRMGKSVVLIEPSKRIGGLTTGGLGSTDIGNKGAIGGIAREFYVQIKAYYNDPVHWNWQQREEFNYLAKGTPQEYDTAMWRFEPSVALTVFEKMLCHTRVKVVLGQRLDRGHGVVKEKNRIVSITMESGTCYRAKMFIDATYEGDLMAAAGVQYTIGRESNRQYGETLNGIQPDEVSQNMRGKISRNAINHNFVARVSPYVLKGDLGSGVPVIVSLNGSGRRGEGDRSIQAYCFRMCLTDHPDNRIPFAKPVNYDERDYELLFRNFEAGETKIPWINTPMPNRKTDINNSRGFSTDFIGQNYDYPEASYAERKAIVERHRLYQQGLMWTLAYHPRIPEIIRKEVSRWGMCKDEFTEGEGWQEQLYIREARRMVSEYVMTQRHCEGYELASDPIGLAAYGMDSHHVKRYIDSLGFVQNEGNVESPVASPYPISYRSIVPKVSECTNLLVPVCLSATHIAFGSIRMEPVFMVLGQSAATAAALAMDKKCSVQSLPYELLRKQLLADHQFLEWATAPK